MRCRARACSQLADAIDQLASDASAKALDTDMFQRISRRVSCDEPFLSILSEQVIEEFVQRGRGPRYPARLERRYLLNNGLLISSLK